jgi:hypothetical protein
VLLTNGRRRSSEHLDGLNGRDRMLPILLGLLVFGLLIVLSGTAVAPFIYTLF